jgi:hypothetical protein
VDVVAKHHQASPAAGLPIGKWTNLGIHHSIVPRQRDNSTSDNWPNYTTYILRNHDRVLRKELRRVTEDNAEPLMVTLVGTSSTGKTRALREALITQLPSWPLIRPTSSLDLVRQISTGIPSGCVLWLDELQNYLDSDGAAAVVGGLTALLTTPGVGPFVAVATIWPDNCARLTRTGRSRKSRALAGQIRTLLGTMTMIIADEDFASADREDVRLAAATDPRIREAIETSGGPTGKLTQTIAGGPVLLDRYFQKPSSAAPVFTAASIAVITAAMDLCRIGYPSPVPAWAIKASAHDYLFEPSDRVQPATWITSALNEASESTRGVSALTPVRTDRGGGVADAYELHDYLLQHHITANRSTPTRAALWDTITMRSNVLRIAKSTRASLAENAVGRGLYSHARLLRPAGHKLQKRAPTNADLVDGDGALGKLANLFITGRHRGPISHATMMQFAELIAEHPDDEDGLRQWVDENDTFPARIALAELLANRGNPEDELELQARASNGDIFAQKYLAQLLASRGDSKSIIALKAMVHATYTCAAPSLIEIYRRRASRRTVELDVNADPVVLRKISQLLRWRSRQL